MLRGLTDMSDYFFCKCRCDSHLIGVRPLHDLRLNQQIRVSYGTTAAVNYAIVAANQSSHY